MSNRTGEKYLRPEIMELEGYDYILKKKNDPSDERIPGKISTAKTSTDGV